MLWVKELYFWRMKETSPSDDIQAQLYSLVIPQEILEHFEVTSVTERENAVTIVLIEKVSNIHKNISSSEAVLNGYMNQLELQSFPIQAKSCYLQLLRRRWKKKGSDGTQSYYNEYDFAASGTKSTKAFGAFLKENF